MLQPLSKTDSVFGSSASQAGPKVSVIFYLEPNCASPWPAVDLLVEQTFQDFELIVIEDGASGLRHSQGTHLDRINTIWITSGGSRRSEAINMGLAAARGKYITILDPEQIPAPFFLEALVRAVEFHPETGMAFANVFMINQQKSIIGRTSNEIINYRQLIFRSPPPMSMLFSKEAQEAVGEFDPQLEGSELHDFMIRIAEAHPVTYMPEALAYQMLSPGEQQGGVRPAAPSLPKVIRKTWSRRQGRVDLADFYPTLADCTNQNHAIFAAAYDLGVLALTSPVFMDRLPIMLLEQAISLFPDFIPAHINLAIALGLNGQWEKALQRVRGIPRDIHPKAVDWITRLNQACLDQSTPELYKLIVSMEPPIGRELFEKEEERKHVFSYTLAQASII